MARGLLTASVIGVLLFFSGIVLAQDVCSGADRALVLSGGGTKGAYEAAAAYHLIVHRGCDFKDLSGVSAGALNVSYLAQASMESDSLKHLQQQASALVEIWRDVTDPSAFMAPRFLGRLRMFLFGLEGLNDFSALKELIRKNISVEKLRKSGRHVRVGYISFFDGGYREISPCSPSPHPEENDQYLDYVFASALIPVFGDMPLIRQRGDNADPATWTQFADGGVRHSTPVPGYFPNSEIVPLLASSGGVPVPSNQCGADEPPPHPRPIQGLFIVVAGPYKKLDDRIEQPMCDNQPCRQMHDGRDIAMRSVWAALESPYRWDINYAITANNMLKWRHELICTMPTALNKIEEIPTRFPVSSFNQGPKYDLPYQPMLIITPNASLTDGIYDVTKQVILKQLWAGCRDANDAMVDLSRPNMSVPDMRAVCEHDFPYPTAKNGSQ
ncbi:MAG: patatin-like phospholipase family protein [candidate division NC10 bacterium]|nr:patatin-like phospholipase family protein [candidate division NC10 bacterium]MDE2320472.1 patatin-like phospholipase family protein [candidate division NC10 bacterium]